MKALVPKFYDFNNQELDKDSAIDKQVDDVVDDSLENSIPNVDLNEKEVSFVIETPLPFVRDAIEGVKPIVSDLKKWIVMMRIHLGLHILLIRNLLLLMLVL